MKTRYFSMTLVILFAAITVTQATNNKVMNPSTVSSHEIATEQALTVENWMVNDCFWKCIENNCFRWDYDQSLSLESWMTDLNTWENAVYLSNDNEEPMTFESWMTDDCLWNQYDFCVDKEESLQIESWMTDDHVWGNNFQGMVCANK